MKKVKNFIALALVIFTFLIVPASTLLAQEELSSGVAISVEINEEVQDGDIISTNSNGYVRANTSFDSSIYGVVSFNPSVGIGDPDIGNAFYVMTFGESRVRVSTQNGPINEGDFITSSTTPGVGVRADTNGTVIGTALEAYTETDPEVIGLIKVSINPHFTVSVSDTGGNLLALIRTGGGAYQAPVAALRYILAAIVVIVSFVLGFMYFVRIATKGVESLGRNPLASRVIELGLIINILFAIAIILAGLGIAYLILIL